MVGLRGVIAIIFGLILVLVLRTAKASLALLFTTYVAADVFCRCDGTHCEATLALMEPTAGRIYECWGSKLNAALAAHRLDKANGRAILAFAGAVSTGWGILLATFGPDATAEPRAMAG